MTVASLLVVAVLALDGCAGASKMAASQPDRKDLSVLRPGTPRALVVAELGQPLASSEDGRRRVDLFHFKQGYSRTAKTTRAVLHGVANVLTLSLWDVIGTPLETIYTGTPLRVEVVYDEHDRVMSATASSPGTQSGPAGLVE